MKFPMDFIRRIGWTAVGFTYFLVALGGTVRATDSGLSCPDWPLCYGKAYAAIDYHTFLEQFHRYVAAIVSVLVVTLAISAFLWARRERQVLIPALIAPVLLIIQIVLGGLTVLWKLPPTIITAHLGTALAIFAMVITIAVMASKPQVSKESPAKTRKFARLAMTNALLVYGLMLSGSYVVGSGASLACAGWPLCTPQFWAITNHLADINILHRLVATLVGLVLIWTLSSAWRRRKVAPRQAWVSLAAGILFVAQAIVGGLIVLLDKPDFVAGLHLALATAVWGMLVVLAAMAAHQLRSAPQEWDEGNEESEGETLTGSNSAKKEAGLIRQTISNYVDLMKPHVTVLLLGTTAAAMAIAERGLPPVGLLLATLLGGAMWYRVGDRGICDSLAVCELFKCRTSLFGDCLLCVCVYAGLETHIGPEYCDWGSSRCCARTSWLGSSDQYGDLTCDLAVCTYFLLDAAAFLGLVFAHSEGL